MTCWIVNRARARAHVAWDVKDPNAVIEDRRRVIEPGDYADVPGTVASWRAKLKAYPHLEVRDAEPDPEEDLTAVDVLPKPKRSRKPGNRKSRDEIENA